MKKNPPAWKNFLSAHKKEILIGVITALIIASGGSVFAYISKLPGKVEFKNGITRNLKLYEADINRNAFNAHHYFSSDVNRFFEMEQTTPEKINRFWKTHFNKLFLNMKIRFDFSSLKIDDSNGAEPRVSITMYSDYYNTQEQRQHTNERSRYDMHYDSDYRMTYLVQEVFR